MSLQRFKNGHSISVNWCKFLFVIWLIGLVALLNVAKAEPPFTALTFSPDHRSVLAGSQRGLLIVDWPRLDNKQSKPLDMDNIHDLSISPDGSHLLIGGGSPGVVGIVQLRRWPDLELVRAWHEHQDVVYSVAWRGNGKEWVSSGWDGKCRVFEMDAVASTVTMKSHSGPVFAATFISTGQIASAGEDKTIVVWDSASGQASKVLRQHTGTVHALAYQPGVTLGNVEPLLASASEDRTVRFWQASLGRMVRFHRFKSTPRSIVWTHDGRWLIIGCDDGAIFQVDPKTLTIQDYPQQGAKIMNLVANEGEIALTIHSEIKRVETLR